MSTTKATKSELTDLLKVGLVLCGFAGTYGVRSTAAGIEVTFRGTRAGVFCTENADGWEATIKDRPAFPGDTDAFDALLRYLKGLEKYGLNLLEDFLP